MIYTYSQVVLQYFVTVYLWFSRWFWNAFTELLSVATLFPFTIPIFALLNHFWMKKTQILSILHTGLSPTGRKLIAVFTYTASAAEFIDY